MAFSDRQLLPVTVPVMQVGVMRMRVPQGRMPMPVGMRLRHRPVMRVPMVRVMFVAVLVFERLVLMFVIVAFGEMHP